MFLLDTNATALSNNPLLRWSVVLGLVLARTCLIVWRCSPATLGLQFTLDEEGAQNRIGAQVLDRDFDSRRRPLDWFRV